MFAPQDEIRVQLPAQMRGVVEKLRSSGFSLGTVSALELISCSGAPQRRAAACAVAYGYAGGGQRAGSICSRPRTLANSARGGEYRQAHIGELERASAAGGFFSRRLFRSTALEHRDMHPAQAQPSSLH